MGYVFGREGSTWIHMDPHGSPQPQPPQLEEPSNWDILVAPIVMQLVYKCSRQRMWPLNWDTACVLCVCGRSWSISTICRHLVTVYNLWPSLTASLSPSLQAPGWLCCSLSCFHAPCNTHTSCLLTHRPYTTDSNIGVSAILSWP